MTPHFSVDKHVPIPPRTGRRPRDLWTPWPFNLMDVGDSFFISRDEPCAHNVSQAWGEFVRMNPGRKFTMRTLERDLVTQLPGIRVWRVK